MAALVRADDTLVLKDGRRIAVRRLARRDGQVLFETTKGERFSVPEDQVVSPPLELDPAGGGAPAGPVATEQTLVLKDGRNIQVRRLGRRDGLVLFETTRGEAFSVREDQVVSPPIESIPVVGGTAPADQVREQTLVLKDGRRIQVLRLARRGGQVVFQTTRGEGFSVPEDQVVSPPIETIPSLDATPGPTATPTPPPTPETPPVPEATPAPPTPPGALAAGARLRAHPLALGSALPRGPALAARPARDPYNQNILKGDKPIAGNSMFLVLTGALESPFEGRNLPVGSGVSAERAGSQEFFGQYGQFFTQPAGHGLRGGVQGPDRVQAQDVRPQGHGRLQPELPARVRAQRRPHRPARGQDAPARGRVAGGGVRGGQARRPLAELRRGLGARGHPALRVRLPRPHLQRHEPGRAPVRQRVEQPLAVQPRRVRPAGEGHQQRPQHVREARAARLHRERLPPGHLHPRLHALRSATTAARTARPRSSTSTRTGSWCGRRASAARACTRSPRTTWAWPGDGHLGKINVSHAAYYAFGTDEDHGVGGHQDIRAGFGALEASIDKDWTRFKATFVYASGRRRPAGRQGQRLRLHLRLQQLRGRAVQLLGALGHRRSPRPRCC